MPRNKVRNPPPVPVKAVWLIGIAGLLPFVVGAVCAFWPANGELVDATRLYGLVMLSFIAGSHWGLNIRHQRTLLLLLSALPVLVGWVAWLSLDRRGEAVVLAMAFLATQLLDEYQTAAGYLHRKYRSLRRLETAVAAISLICMANARG